MISKIIKILLLSGKSYLLFIFIATFLSLFSYILSSNVVSSVDEYLASQIKPLLGGDLVISSRSDILGDEFYAKYDDTFIVAETIETSSTLFDISNQPSLVDIIFIGDAYPIYDDFEFETISDSGSLIVSQEIFDNYGTSLDIFGESYAVKGVLSDSPLGDLSIFSNAFTVYLPLSDFEKTGLSPENARLDYRAYLQFRGEYDSSIVESVKSDDILGDSRIRSLEDRNENIGEITDRFGLFLNIFNLIVFVLTFFIIIISLEIFYKNLKNTIGLLSILGLKKTNIFFISLISLGLIYVASFLLASVANSFALSFLAKQYDFFTVYQSSYIKGASISLVLLLVGVASPFYKVYRSSVQGLLSDSAAFSRFRFGDYLLYIGLIFGGFFTISMISGIELVLALIYSAVCIASIVVLYIVTSFLLRVFYAFIKIFISPKRNFYAFDAIRSTVKPGNVSFFIVFSSLISFLSIFVFYVFSGSFLSFLDDLTQNSNDTFIVNVSPDDIELTREFFESENIFEISAVRIREINGFTLEDYKNLNGIRGGYTREFSLTTGVTSDDLLSGEALSEGGISLGDEFAADLQLRVGDEMLLSIAGIEKTFEVQNIRQIERNGTDPFFILSGTPQDFRELPKRYFVSYDSRKFPEDIQFRYAQATGSEVSFINTREIIELVLDVAAKILVIVYFCLIYICIFSFLTFIVSVSFLKTFKTSKLKLLYTLGGQKKYLHRSVLIEYSYLVVLGMSVSIILGTIALGVLAYFVDFFDIDMISYIEGIALLGGLFLIMLIYLIFSKNKI